MMFFTIIDPAAKSKKTYQAVIRFIICMLCIVLLGMGAWTLYHYEVLPESLHMQCIIYQTTGFYCPGCGASRACYAILHGSLREAAGYNPLLVGMLPLAGGYILIRGADWLFTGQNRIDKYIPDKFLYIILGVIIIYGIVRNIPVWPFYLMRP